MAGLVLVVIWEIKLQKLVRLSYPGSCFFPGICPAAGGLELKKWRGTSVNKIKCYICNLEKQHGGCSSVVRALDCGSRGRRFNPDLPPEKARISGLFCF